MEMNALQGRYRAELRRHHEFVVTAVEPAGRSGTGVRPPFGPQHAVNDALVVGQVEPVENHWQAATGLVEQVLPPQAQPPVTREMLEGAGDAKVAQVPDRRGTGHAGR